jgi:hypothetical protein
MGLFTSIRSIRIRVTQMRIRSRSIDRGEAQCCQVCSSVFIVSYNNGTGRKVCCGLERVAQVHEYEHDNWINSLESKINKKFVADRYCKKTCTHRELYSHGQQYVSECRKGHVDEERGQEDGLRNAYDDSVGLMC